MTVRHLIADMAAARIELEVEEVGVSWISAGDDPPEHLLSALAVLHTGVRAVLTGKRWFGIDPRTGKACGPRPKDGSGPLAFGALDPCSKLPPNVGLLCVEGDRIMDRITPIARMDLPYLFAAEPARGPGR